MRPTVNFVIHALAAAVLTAFAATSAAAGPAFLKLGGAEGGAATHKDHDNQIEILSYSFGPRQSTSRVSKVDGFTVKQQAVPYKLKPVFVKSWSTSGDASPPRGAGINEMSMDDTAGNERGSVGASETLTVGSGRTEAAQATGKRMHKPLRMRMVYDGGSVTVGGRLAACNIGTAYDAAVIEAAGERFEMQDVVVTGCAADSVSLNYAKVKVRGWNPETKEE